jgi:hypothetical protein
MIAIGGSRPRGWARPARDVAAVAKEQNVLQAKSIYRGHSAVVEVGRRAACGRMGPWLTTVRGGGGADGEHVQDVAWHSLHDSLFASVGDDHRLLMFVPR